MKNLNLLRLLIACLFFIISTWACNPWKVVQYNTGLSSVTLAVVIDDHDTRIITAPLIAVDVDTLDKYLICDWKNRYSAWVKRINIEHQHASIYCSIQGVSVKTGTIFAYENTFPAIKGKLETIKADSVLVTLQLNR